MRGGNCEGGWAIRPWRSTSMNDDRIDFSALDPTADEASLNEIARGIAERSRFVMRARRSRPEAAQTVWTMLASWRRPVLAAASLVGIVSLLMAGRAHRAGISA